MYFKVYTAWNCGLIQSGLRTASDRSTRLLCQSGLEGRAWAPEFLKIAGNSCSRRGLFHQTPNILLALFHSVAVLWFMNVLLNDLLRNFRIMILLHRRLRYYINSYFFCGEVVESDLQNNAILTFIFQFLLRLGSKSWFNLKLQY